MGIYRGAGGTGDAVNDASSEATLVQELVNGATTQANNAAASATTAQAAETQAVISQGLAADSATAAATSETNAETAEANAETAQAAAEAAQLAAETAQTAAELAETNAETAETNAETAQAAAEAAQSAAETAQTAAELAETNASDSATAAATSATNAAASYDAFDDRYLGAKSSNPTVDNDGNALITGALYYNTVSSEMRVWEGTQWVFIGASGAAGVNSFNTRFGDVTLTSSDVTTALTYTPLAPAAIGTTVQAYDADLTTLGAGGSGARSFLGLAIGTDVQAYDAQLADIAGLTPTDNSFIVGNGTNFVAEGASTARTSLGLGTAATTAATDYATAAQGTKADSALQPATIGVSVQSYDVDTTKNDVANTFSANQIISVTDNSNAALRITQLGTGNALLVEDSANPDSTPVVIDSTGRLVVGNVDTYATVAASSAITPTLQTHGTSISTSAIGQFSWGQNPYYTFNKSAGAVGVYTAVAADDVLGRIQFNGADGSAFVGGAIISSNVDGTVTTGNMPSRLAFFTSPTTGALTERMRITNSGNIGIATTAPAAKLQVAGNTILSNVDMLNASYDSVSFSIAGEEATPQGIFFSPDGTRMYVTGTSGDDVNQYSLSTPWLVSSATYVTVFSVASQDLTPTGLFFRADGLKMYVVGNTNDTVFQYSLTTPWSVATATYDSVSFSVATEETVPNGVFFKPNGLTMYISGSTGDDVYQYTLSTAWNVSTATFTQSFSVGSQEIAPSDVSFTGDGTRMFLPGTTGDDVTVYDLTTPWDISTASHIGEFSVAGQDTGPSGIYVKPDGTKFYMVGNTNDSVYQYTIPSIDIQLTGTTAINGGATVAQDLTVNGFVLANNDLKFNSGYGSAATAYGCRAWVNFNGTGTVAIRASGNVSSITDNGTGDYTVNFSTALSDINYDVVGSASNNNTFGSILVNINSTSSGGNLTSTPTTSATRLTVAQPNIGYIDTPYICVSVFR
jgi:sugar lactone lactonase YvrE